MGPLRVAVVADILLSPMGGVARSVQGILDELAHLDPTRLEVTVVARRKPVSINGMRFQRSFSPRVPKLSDAIFALQRPLTLRGYDVVHYIDSRPPLSPPRRPPPPCGATPSSTPSTAARRSTSPSAAPGRSSPSTGSRC